MDDSPASEPVIVPPGQGRHIPGPTGPAMTIKLAGRDTHGAYSLIEYQHAAGAAGPPPHVHDEHEEAFYVIDGELTLLAGDQTITVPPGGMAVVPRGVLHQPSNTGSVAVRFFFISSPPMDGFFEELSALMQSTAGNPSAAELIDIGRRWDSTFPGLASEGGPVVMHNETS